MKSRIALIDKKAMTRQAVTGRLEVSKYDGLRQYLKTLPNRELTLSFDTVSSVDVRTRIGAIRRDSHPWSNETDGQHVQAHVWPKAGRRMVGVDFGTRSVTFSAARDMTTECRHWVRSPSPALVR